MSDLTWLWGQWTWTDVAPDKSPPSNKHSHVPGLILFISLVSQQSLLSPFREMSLKLMWRFFEAKPRVYFLIWKKLLMFQNLFIFLKKIIFKNLDISNDDNTSSEVLLCLNFQLLVFSLFFLQIERKEACFGQQWWLSSGKNVTTLCQDFLPLFSLTSCMPNKTVLCEGIYEGAVSSQVVCRRLVGGRHSSCLVVL